MSILVFYIYTPYSRFYYIMQIAITFACNTQSKMGNKKLGLLFMIFIMYFHIFAASSPNEKGLPAGNFLYLSPSLIKQIDFCICMCLLLFIFCLLCRKKINQCHRTEFASYFHKSSTRMT